MAQEATFFTQEQKEQVSGLLSEEIANLAHNPSTSSSDKSQTKNEE